MVKKIIPGTLALFAIGALAVGCSSGVEFGPKEESAASELGSEQRGCPQLTVRRQMLPSGTTALSVSGVQASIIDNGATLRCGTNATGTFTVGTSPRSELFIVNPNTRITPDGSKLKFSPSLPPQATWQGPAAGLIESLSCIYRGSTLEGAGFPSVSLPLKTVWDYKHDVARNRLYVTCTVTTPNPLKLTTKRPKDVIGTSGDDFIFRCDLTGSARRNACNSVCGGNAQCVASCDTSAGCPVTLPCDEVGCSSNECPPERQCAAASQCGAPGRFTCTNGCCLTVIR
jgi:hypothetical protein